MSSPARDEAGAQNWRPEDIDASAFILDRSVIYPLATRAPIEPPGDVFSPLFRRSLAELRFSAQAPWASPLSLKRLEF